MSHYNPQASPAREERARPVMAEGTYVDLEDPLVPECKFRNVNDDLEAGLDLKSNESGLDKSLGAASDASLNRSLSHSNSRSRIAGAFAAAQRALTPPKYNLDYHAQENVQTWRQGATPPRSTHGTPVRGNSPRIPTGEFSMPPPPPSLFANLPVQKKSARENDSEPSSGDTPIHTPSVTPHGTPRSDMTNKVFSAARHGKHKVVEDCLLQETGYFDPLNTTDHHGNTLFHIACQNGNKKIAKLAIKYGGEMDARNKKGNTGLHFLYQFGYGEIAEYFISKGANASVVNQKGYPCYKGFKGNVEPGGGEAQGGLNMNEGVG